MDIQFCDILLFKNNTLLGKIIKHETKSIYTHSAIALDNFHLAEATHKGIKIDHIEDLSSGYDIYRYKDGLADKQKDKIKNFIYNKITTPYNYKELFSYLLNIELNFDLRFSDKKLICSQFVYWAYIYAGVDLLPNNKLTIITPANISQSKLLTKLK